MSKFSFNERCVCAVHVWVKDRMLRKMNVGVKMDGNNEKHLGYVTLWHFTTSHRGFCTFGQCFQLLLNAITRWSLKQNQTFYHQSFCNIRFFCHIFQKACGVGVCLQIPDLAYSGRFLMLYCPNLHTEWNVLGFVHELEQEFLLLKSIFPPVTNNLFSI